MRLSRDFTLEEMLESTTARRDPAIWMRQASPPDDVVSSLSRLCCNVLQPLRDAFDWPILVNSGYRCPDLNRAVGGSERSQHQHGMAADIKLAPGWRLQRAPGILPEGMLPESAPGMAVLFAKLAIGEQHDQLIHEYGAFPTPAWVHVSHRPEPRNQVMAATRRHGYIRETSYKALWARMSELNLVQI